MTLPLENLDNISFDDLVREAISRIPVYAPGWTDHNKSDPGIAFIELLAWISEMQIYRLNRVGERNILKFLKLMGSGLPKPAERSRVFVTFSLKGGKESKSVAVSRGTVLLARDADGTALPFETQKNIMVTGARLEGLFSIYGKEARKVDNTQANGREHVYFLPFGPNPRQGDALYLALDCSPRNQSITLAFHLRDEPPRPGEDDRDSKLYRSCSLVWEVGGAGNKWLEIKVEPADDETEGLAFSGTISLQVPDDPSIVTSDLFKEISGKSLYLLRCRIKFPIEAGEEEVEVEDGRDHTISTRIDQVLLNTTLARQGRTIQRKGIVNQGEDGPPSMTLELKDLEEQERDIKSLPVQDDFRLTTESRGREILWAMVDDFDSSRPQDAHFTVDKAREKVTFGDGLHGKIPPRDSSINVIYCAGGGSKGNVPAHAIKFVEGDLNESVSVDNLRAAEGGRSEETLEEAVFRAREDLKRCRRAVTGEDYERLAMQTPGIKIKRAKAVPMYHPIHKEKVFNAVTVVVVPDSTLSQPQPSSAMLRTVRDYLDQRRLLTTEVFVYPPQYVTVSVRAQVMPLACQDPKAVVARVAQTVSDFLDPIRGGEEGTGWPFGRPVYISEIYNLIDGVDGVDYVEGVRLKEANGDWSASDVDVPARGLVCFGSSESKIEAMARYEKESKPGISGGI